MSEMVERVSLALGRQIGESLGISDPKRFPKCDHMARAAIAAMREPTREIIAAGRKTAIYDYDDPHIDAAECWRAMIDAALSEEHPSVEGG